MIMGNNGDRFVRVATYARVSTQEQATENTSLAFQESQPDGLLQDAGLVNH